MDGESSGRIREVIGDEDEEDEDEEVGRGDGRRGEGGRKIAQWLLAEESLCREKGGERKHYELVWEKGRREARSFGEEVLTALCGAGGRGRDYGWEFLARGDWTRMAHSSPS